VEITQEGISKIIAAFPGNFAIYKVEGGALKSIYNSPGLPGLSGMSKEEYENFIKDDAAAIVLESDRKQIAELLYDALKDLEHAKDIDFTYRIIHKARDFIWVHALSRFIGTMGGCPVLLTAFLDTSSESLPHNVLVDNSSSLVYVVERSTHELIYAGKKFLEHIGRNKYAGLTCHKYANGFDDPCPWCFLSKMKNGFLHIDQFHMPVNGKWFRIDCHEISWFGRDAVAVYMSEITEQVEKQHKLELDRNSLNDIVENIAVGVSVFKIDGDLFTPLSANGRFVELCGYAADGSAHNDNEPLSGVHPDDRDRIAQEITRLKIPGTYINTVYRYDPNGSGKYFWYKMESKSALINNELLEFTCLSDVTAEKNVEEEVLRSRQMYEAAVETANLSVWEYDIPNHRIILSGNSVTRSDIAKYEIPQIIENVPESVVQWIDDKDAGKMIDVYRRIDAGEKNVSCEYWYKTLPGQEPRCERLAYSVVDDENGRPLKAFGIGQNITSQKFKEMEYARAYQQLSSVDPSTLGAFRLNLTKNWCGDGHGVLKRIISLQETGTVDGFFGNIASRLAGDEKLRRKFLSTFNRKNMLDEFRSGRTLLSAKAPVVSMESGVMWAEGFVRMMLNPNTNEVEAVAWAHDITDNEKDNEIIENVADRKYDHIGIIDPTMRTYELRRKNWVFDNVRPNTKQDYSAVVKTIAEKFVVKDDVDVFIQDTAIAKIVSMIEANGEYNVIFRCYGNGGKILRKQVQYSWLDASKMEILVIQDDITALYEEEQRHLLQLRDALEKAETANRARSEFISRISHDVRTPMNAITSMTSFALEDMHDPEKLRNDLEKIQTSNGFLLSLINDILDISKIDSGKMELHPEPYPYEEYAGNVRSMFEPMCAAKDIAFVIEHKDLDGVVITDRIRVNQIVLNLISNAVKYTPSGGKVTFSSYVKRRADGMMDCAFEVKDTGIGMSSEFQKKMFEPFTQEEENSERRKQAAGTGLGLSIVKRIVDLMNGEITVKSEIGKGTDIKVKFVFPEALGYKERMEPETADIDTKLSGKVLLAEDNDINVEIAVRILESFGLDVCVAKNGAMALEAFESSETGEFSLVLMDIQMPVMDGYEATKKIRALMRPDAKAVPIIAMTADAFAEAVERCKACGMNEHVAKPIDPAALKKVLCTYLKN
jgi:signal transduction histidine kinase/PAS domain-containing protein/ActR/RegA family two-component response regulator